jgi:nucleotide-binding universal stress UspA family protein
MTTAHPVPPEAGGLESSGSRKGEMFDNVVVGVDDPEAGRDALELAKQLVSGDGQLLLVYVEAVMLAPDPSVDPDWQATERRRALERLLPLGREARVTGGLLAVQAGSVAAGLHEAVKRHGDLLVVGASRRDEFEQAFVGDDDTRKVLEDSPSPVAVAPARYAMDRPELRTIGVAYDGSPGSERAIAVARRLARERRAELSAFEAIREPVHAYDPRVGRPEVDEDVEEARDRVAALRDLGAHAASGDPPEELARYAASVDLLVLGPHERRPLDRLSLGSTAQRLADDPACPVLVLPTEGSQ